VDRFELGWRDLSVGLEEAAVVEPVVPVGCINSVATPGVLICRRIEFVHPTGSKVRTVKGL